MSTPSILPTAGRARLIATVLAAAAVGTSQGIPAIPASAAVPTRAIGDIRVFAHVPYPGNPGSLAVDGETVWVDTSSANLDRPFDGFSDVFAYKLQTGRLQPRSPNPIAVLKNRWPSWGWPGWSWMRPGGS